MSALNIPTPAIKRRGASVPVAVLVDPQRDIPRGEMNVRIDDYLNDKIQTAADFRSLQSLLDHVEAQKQALESQVEEARAQLDESRKFSETCTSRMLEQKETFERQQESVQRRLMLVTKSDTLEEATERLKGPMEKLRRVQIARSYVELLQDVNGLAKEARGHLPGKPKEALKPYLQLQELTKSLLRLQEDADNAAVHLVSYVQGTTDRLWIEMNKIMTDEFEGILEKSSWPAAEELSRDWSDCFEKLLDLQGPEILNAREPLILLPMSILCKPFVQEFRYHFFSDKPTNQPQQLGDYFFEWFLGTIGKWEDFFRDNVTPVMAAHFRRNTLAANTLYVDAVSALITSFLPVLKEKVDSVVVQISNEPQFLSRFIMQLMSFDETIRTRFDYDAGNPEVGWRGLTWEVLDVWFDRWAQVEKDFALRRYWDIMKSEDVGQIDYDSTAPGKTKGTYGSVKVADLIQSVTSQYKLLKKFSQKMNFLISIQAEILDQYLGRLNESLEAYMAKTTTVGRAIHGVTKEEQAELEGIGGLERLCRVYSSSHYITTNLREWANDEFFIDLWKQLQDRAKVTDLDDNLVGSMTYKEIKECTSNLVGGSEKEGSVFDVSIANYERIREKAEGLIGETLCYAFPAVFRQYFSKPEWTTLGEKPTTNSMALAVTPELDQPLKILAQHMEFLHKTLASPPFRRIWRRAFDNLQNLLFQNVLMKQDFTTLGAGRLQQDIVAIQSVVELIVGSSTVTESLRMPKLVEAVTLLNVPVEVEVGQMSLATVATDIFGPNSQAESTLKWLGLERISVAEARKILRRRVEAASL